MHAAGKTGPVFLVGIDLEALPLTSPNDPTGWKDLEILTHVVLDTLRRHRWQATFFTVGSVAEVRPDLIAMILEEGHEIACHTHAHRRIDQLSHEQFKRDLETNLEMLRKAGVSKVTGFRAPFFSLTEQGAAEVYQTLRHNGIRYSSSVSDSRNLPGWSDRARALAQDAGIVELPVSSLWPAPIGMPVGIPLGGIYWRFCPDALLLPRVRRIASYANYLSSFFHPHDFYSAETSYVGFSNIRRHPVMAALLAVGRRSVEHKLDLVASLGFSFPSFQGYLDHEQPAHRSASVAGNHRH